jgi:hypothetical protein
MKPPRDRLHRSSFIFHPFRTPHAGQTWPHTADSLHRVRGQRAVREAGGQVVRHLRRPRGEPHFRHPRHDRRIQYTAAYPHGERHLNIVYQWFLSGGVGADIAFQLDPLSIVMSLVVTWVGFVIHLYSVGYMGHDPGYARYFAYLNLFLAAMLILVLGSSYLFIFVGWEGVGLCSYLLIGFYLRQELCRLRRQESVHRQPHRRLRIPRRDVHDVRLSRLGGL